MLETGRLCTFSSFGRRLNYSFYSSYSLLTSFGATASKGGERDSNLLTAEAKRRQSR